MTAINEAPRCIKFTGDSGAKKNPLMFARESQANIAGKVTFQLTPKR